MKKAIPRESLDTIEFPKTGEFCLRVKELNYNRFSRTSFAYVGLDLYPSMHGHAYNEIEIRDKSIVAIIRGNGVLITIAIKEELDEEIDLSIKAVVISKRALEVKGIIHIIDDQTKTTTVTLEEAKKIIDDTDESNIWQKEPNALARIKRIIAIKVLTK